MNECCDRLAVGEAAYAPLTDGYWACAGNPRSTIEGRKPSLSQNPPHSASPPTDIPSGQEAMRILEAMSVALNQCDTFESFRERMRNVLEQVQW